MGLESEINFKQLSIVYNNALCISVMSNKLLPYHTSTYTSVPRSTNFFFFFLNMLGFGVRLPPPRTVKNMVFAVWCQILWFVCECSCGHIY